MGEVIPSEGATEDLQQAAARVSEAAYLLDTWYHLPGVEEIIRDLRMLEDWLWECDARQSD